MLYETHSSAATTMMTSLGHFIHYIIRYIYISLYINIIYVTRPTVQLLSVRIYFYFFTLRTDDRVKGIPTVYRRTIFLIKNYDGQQLTCTIVTFPSHNNINAAAAESFFPHRAPTWTTFFPLPVLRGGGGDKLLPRGTSSFAVRLFIYFT